MLDVHMYVLLCHVKIAASPRLRRYDSVGLQFFCSPDEHRQWYSYWQKQRLRWWKEVSV